MSQGADQIGFGGSCHWCTEAIFLSLRGVQEVRQGWAASSDLADSFSEAVIVIFDPAIISLHTLIAIHLHTHRCTSFHSMRDKYRSAVYTFSDQQQSLAECIILDLQKEFSSPIITEVVEFSAFRLNRTEFLNYYFRDPDKPFCRNIVNPKLQQLLRDFSAVVDHEKLHHLATGESKQVTGF